MSSRFHSISIAVAAAMTLSAGQQTLAQCNTTNATSCVCANGADTCDLLPDMTISWYGIANYMSGPNQQNNRVYITGSTPNIGHGPFVAKGVDFDGYRWFVCGTDTFSIFDPTASQQFSCPNGGVAKQLTFQRVYRKEGPTMTSYQRLMPQGMTYHPTHGHTHFDQWGLFSLRLPETGVTDPRQWPVVSTGYKLGFCLMDYNRCSDGAALHHCKDDNTVVNQGTTLNNSDFPNFALGGGNYGCSMVEMGISSGYTDIYSEYLDGMWIDVPAGTCNGEYWIVYEVDPFDVVLEENEDNNYTAVPITLTQWPSGTPAAHILADGTSYICLGDSVRLRANAGLSYLWSNGETGSAIWAGPGFYTVTVTTYCGTATSAPFTVTELTRPDPPEAASASICEGQQATLQCSGTNPVWYDVTGELLGTGNQFTTPPLFSSTVFNVYDENTVSGIIGFGGRPDNSGQGAYHAGGQHLSFNVNELMVLRSVKVYAGSAGVRTVELYNSVGALLAFRTMMVPAGESRIELNMSIAPGTGYQLAVGGFCDLFRNSSGVSFPYDVAGVASISGSSGGGSYYYYFYDWEVETGGGACQSDMVTVPVTVNNCTGIEEPNALRALNIFPNPTDGLLNLRLHLVAQTDVMAEVHDMMGRRLMASSWQDRTGETLEQLDISALPKGVYAVSVTVSGRRYDRRVVLN